MWGVMERLPVKYTVYCMALSNLPMYINCYHDDALKSWIFTEKAIGLFALFREKIRVIEYCGVS